MLRDFMTPDVFEIGIIRYLKRYSYQNTVNSHLWESLTNVSACVFARVFSKKHTDWVAACEVGTHISCGVS